jgi:hypothetical protein
VLLLCQASRRAAQRSAGGLGAISCRWWVIFEVGRHGATRFLQSSFLERPRAILKPAAGLYTIAVFAANLLVRPQAFALVISGDLQSGLVRI